MRGNLPNPQVSKGENHQREKRAEKEKKKEKGLL